MKLKDILAISGKPGLYKFLSQARNGIIVEGVTDKKRTAISSATKVSSLSDIAIYTETEEIPLKDILKKLFEKEGGKQTISHKSDNKELISLFEEIVPDYDRERVYASDIKKLISWYNLLIENNLIDPNEPDDEEIKEETPVTEEITPKEKSAEKSEKKTEKKAPKKNEGKTEKPKTKPKGKKDE